MTTPPTIDIAALLDATADLESGHPVEAVLMAHGCTARDSAYEVVRRYDLALRREQTASTPAWCGYWAIRARQLRPCVEAIALHLGTR
jgi:hypothetical protein